MLSIADLITDYGDPRTEALRCRHHCALFDFSFVYRVRVSGREAVSVIENFQPRRVADMSIGQIRYSVKCDARRKVRSDLTIWRFDENVFDIMSGCEADVEELRGLESETFQLQDLSESTAILALQGPETLSRLAELTDVSALLGLSYFGFTEIDVRGVPCLAGRLGYSGEAGIELVIGHSHKEQMWSMLSATVAPAGFAAIDILRIEAGFFLFTHECRVAPSIGELGLSTLLGEVEGQRSMRLVAFRAQAGRNVDLTLWQSSIAPGQRPAPGEIVITSACFSPWFDTALGLGFVPFQDSPRSPVDPTNEFHNIRFCSLPPYDPHKRRPRRAWG